MKIDLNNADLSEFTEIFLLVLDKHASKIQKFIRANNSNFATKNLRETIMKRLNLRNKYLRERTDEPKSLYNKQINLCVSILRKNKRDMGNLNNKIVTDNGIFWKTISPLFSEKAFHRECITVKESNKTITNNEELAETFNTFFGKIVPNLNLENSLGDYITNLSIIDPVFCEIQIHESYPNILKIKEMMGKKNLTSSQIVFITISIIHCLVHIFHQIGKMLL